MKNIVTEQEMVNYFDERFQETRSTGSWSGGHWGAMKREIIEKARKKVDFNSMLDIGCGDVQYIAEYDLFAISEFKYFGLDGAPYMIRMAKKKYSNQNRKFDCKKISELIQTDMNQKFDIIVCMDTLFHIVDDKLYVDFLNWLFNSSAKAIAISFLRVAEEEGQTCEAGHFVVRDFSKIIVPARWVNVKEMKSPKKERRRIALFTRQDLDILKDDDVLDGGSFVEEGYFDERKEVDPPIKMGTQEFERVHKPLENPEPVSLPEPKPIITPDNVCDICGKELKNARGVTTHKRIKHKPKISGIS